MHISVAHGLCTQCVPGTRAPPLPCRGLQCTPSEDIPGASTSTGVTEAAVNIHVQVVVSASLGESQEHDAGLEAESVSSFVRNSRTAPRVTAPPAPQRGRGSGRPSALGVVSALGLIVLVGDCWSLTVVLICSFLMTRCVASSHVFFLPSVDLLW